MSIRKIVCLLIMCGIAFPVLAEDEKKQDARPDAPAIKQLQTISLFYKVTTDGIELNWTPATGQSSGGVKVTSSESNSEPLYPYDGYVVWLPGSGHTSCVVPLDKAASDKPRYYRVCSVKPDNHSEYVALSNVVVVPPVAGAPDADRAGDKQKKKEPRPSASGQDSAKKKGEKAPEPAQTGEVSDKDKPVALPEAKAAKRPAGSVSVGHNDTDISKCSPAAIEKAKRLFQVWYGHTSHGSQITSGMSAMNRPPFIYSRSGDGDSLQYIETGGDLGHNGDDAWEKATRRYLDGGGKANVIMWSWCGGASDNTPEGIAKYLSMMDKLEADYPGRIFIYMTGHLDGSGENGNLHRMNNLIREYCKKNGKVLFDFADIESFDPSGNSFLDKNADDGCNWRSGSQRGNWARDWLAKNPNHGIDLPSSAAHTEPLNGALKARAFWVLLAKLAAASDS